jgi:murein DD-endopeptidase MepM/ murein hydrolase activator NlpD
MTYGNVLNKSSPLYGVSVNIKSYGNNNFRKHPVASKKDLPRKIRRPVSSKNRTARRLPKKKPRRKKQGISLVIFIIIFALGAIASFFVYDSFTNNDNDIDNSNDIEIDNGNGIGIDNDIDVDDGNSIGTGNDNVSDNNNPDPREPLPDKGHPVYDDVIWPVNNYELAGPFGWRWHSSRWDFHRAMDLRAKEGEPIYAIAPGVVDRTASEDDPNDSFNNGGNVVIIEHLADPDTPFTFHGKEQTRYYSVNIHMQDFLVKEGDTVEQGQLIGHVGHAGTASTDHNHFEIRVVCRHSWDGPGDDPNKQCDIMGVEADPHVNPLRFLPYDDQDIMEAEIVTNDPLTVEVRTHFTEADFNSIKIDGVEVVNWDERVGINTSDRDENPYNGLYVDADKFTVGTEWYVVRFEFQDKVYTGQTIEVLDIWGKGVTLEN